MQQAVAQIAWGHNVRIPDDVKIRPIGSGTSGLRSNTVGAAACSFPAAQFWTLAGLGFQGSSEVLTSASASQPRRSFSEGTFDRYGLISRIGVPSSVSTPRTRSRGPSRPRNSTTVKPIGFGRRGDRVANTPCGRLSLEVYQPIRTLRSDQRPRSQSNERIHRYQ